MRTAALSHRWLAPLQPIGPHLQRLSQEIRARSARLVGFLDVRMDLLIGCWACLIVLAGVAKVVTAAAAPASGTEALALLLPYLLIAFAPIAGYRIAAGSFPRGVLTAQPEIRLARIGKWQPLDLISARGNPAYGPIGFMASLLVGILLNVPTRTLEYLVAVPAVGSTAPAWAQTYFMVMTADVIVMNFFYMVCFVLALRSNPLFPRMLLFAWAFDILMQLVIADRLAAAPALPHEVVEPLVALLRGNITKVLISAFVWLPYLLLSERVNVTYRFRTAIGD
jgi:hypothetical protein